MRRLGCLGDEYVGCGEGPGSSGAGGRRREALREGLESSARGCGRDPRTAAESWASLLSWLRENGLEPLSLSRGVRL